MNSRLWLCMGALAGGIGFGCGSEDKNQSEPEVTGTEPPTELLAFQCRQDTTKSSTPIDGSQDEPRSFRDTGKTVGVALNGGRLGETAYTDTIAAQFNQLTPENEMKWETIEPEQGVFNFEPADAIVQFAKDHGMVVRGHTLVWHSQLADWVNQLSGEDAVRAAMTNHIQTVVAHFRDTFPGTIVAWDVVNEAIDTPMGMAVYRDDIFYRELGEGYIAEAFKIAHDTDPAPLLYYNDYGIEGMAGVKPTMAFNMLSDFVANGVPVDGVGLQMHTSSDDRGPGFVEFQGNMARYAALGLKVDVTEMDVSLCAIGNSEFALESQRFRYNRIVSACFDSPACRAVTLWGLDDPGSWLNTNGCGMSSTALPMPLAFDGEEKRKPAWWGIYDGLTGCGYQ